MGPQEKWSKYCNEPLGEIKIVDDFLPNPKDLVLKEETAKIIISLTKSSIDFFKNEAAKQHINYQVMIRALLDKHASYYNEKTKRRSHNC